MTDHQTNVARDAVVNSTQEQRDHFYEYYEKESQSAETFERFRAIYTVVQRQMQKRGHSVGPSDVADVGCGAGTQCIIWAEKGHRVHGIDINEPLVELAKRRSKEYGLEIDFRTGTASDLPWDSSSMDICLVPELLEHVPEWRQCLDEFERILRPGGILFLSTNNKLCPKQKEFELPLYSWYPAFLKHHYERLAMTTRPELAAYAKFPAVNWFTFYELRTVLAEKGMEALDRFDVADFQEMGKLSTVTLEAIKSNRILRWLAHVATPYTMVVAVKNGMH